MDRKTAAVKARIYTHPYVLAGLVPLVFFLAFYFYPLAGIFLRSFVPDFPLNLHIDLSFWDQVTGSQRLHHIIRFTFWQAAVSTGLTLVFAFPCAFVMSHYQFRGKKFLTLCASIPFVLPAVVVAAALDASFGKNGWLGMLNIRHPLVLIFMAHVFYNFSVMLRILTTFWTGLRANFQEAAAMLGAGPFLTFIHITLPLLMPAIWAASFLVFIFCFSSFGIILILGGPAYSTIEAEIYRQAAHMFNLPLASFLSLLQIGFTLVLMSLYTAFSRKAVRFVPKAGHADYKYPERFRDKAAVTGSACFIILLCLFPLAALAGKSLIHEGQLSLIYYQAIFDNPLTSIFHVPPFTAIKFSFIFAGTALIIALVTGLCAALCLNHLDRINVKSLAAFFDPLFMLPLSTSAVTLGFGIIITLDRPPLNLRSSILLVPLVHALVGFPFVLRAVLPALKSIPNDIREAAAMLGASPGKIFRCIDLPLISGALTAGAVFAFTISMGEFGATIFTASPRTPTIPLAIYRFLGQPGAMNYGQAMAIATLLMAVTAAGFILIETISSKGIQQF
ncbi:iron ABC transporter permease [uncultured Desulfobacter sp.]|uniref:ABC transporter permease n=1 Tax=uncultured Desulfobacter sp. TaxID=240139 RepID=UPI002AAC1BE9|nr:iron ABC transporter permease [uncultured Desulfobacter sp.]